MSRIDGVILAGGRGQRMGGADKGLLPWQNQPMVAWVAQALRPQVQMLWISANRNLDSYARYADAVISDVTPDHLGPLAGLYAVAERSDADWLLTAPCDMPLLQEAVFDRLLRAARGTDGSLRAAVAQSGGRLQPALCLLPRESCLRIPQHLQSGQLRWSAFVWAQNPLVVPFAAEWARQFENINNAADQQRLSIALNPDS
jgi:molybdopterin-guanine dinucleotide biosynthesis protein A